MAFDSYKTKYGSLRASLSEKVRAVVFGPEKNPHMSPVMSYGEQIGFRYRENEFVHHANLHVSETAFFNLLRHQKIILVVCTGLLAYAFFLNWQVTAIALFGILTVLYFFDLLFGAFIIFRSYKTFPEIHISAEEVAALKDEDCPTYTIFCPLYKEWQVVPQFVEAMQKLDYPHEKLQVLFLLEQNDVETIEKISSASLPKHFQIVVVPHSMPKTKPKAMNYGLNYVSGDYVVIYDAEDVPEVDQLKKAVLAFKKVGADVACVQAKLNFYNPQQNILTRLFTAEYSLWFDLVLPGFQSISAPIPLGGTSNHFRTDMLRKFGGWDAFNVTEDCDLGMRLVKRGYKTAIIDSTTHEEANSDMLNWYNQRSRWIKGYIQTYFVHMRDPKKYFVNGKGRDFFLFQLIVGGKILSLFINPIMWVITTCYFLFRAKIGLFIESFFPGPILYIGVFSLVFGNFLYLYYYMVGCVKRGYEGLIKYVFLIPFYWLGMSFAAWKAMYEIVVKPHYWAKTVHGLHLAPAENLIPSTPRVAFDIETVLKNQPPRRVPVMASAVTIPIHISGPIAAPRVDAPPEGEPELVQLLSDESGKGTWIVKIKAFATSSAGLLVMSSVIANFINFAFNVYLGRVLTLADFGTISIVNVFTYLLSLFTGALSITTTHEVSFFEGRAGGAGNVFFRKIWMYVFLIASAGTVIWLSGIEVLSTYFNVSNLALIIAFAPAIIFETLASFNKGYLHGTFSFGSVALSNLSEVVGKLTLAIVFVHYGLSAVVSLAIPGSIVVSWFISTLCVALIYRKIKTTQDTPVVISKKFPIGFYMAAFVSSISIAAFLTTDVVLAKHYLSLDDAGRYGMLSLVGKMIFFFGSLLNTFIMPVVSRAEGEHKDASWEFTKLFAGAAALTISATAGLGIGGFFLVPLLLGAKAISIVPYVPLYAFAICLFTLSSAITVYGLARKRYIFPIISLCSSIMLWISIADRHASIQDFVYVITAINFLGFTAICTVHVFYDQCVYLVRNVFDMLRVFQALPDASNAGMGKMRILIFNWRDSESVFAGGAETYIHAIAERWALAGHSVTLFTSNDGKQEPNGEINDIRVIRRGGFYGVYALAPLYYLFKFRGEFDAIIDCENGIPFFTPFYAKENVYCLLHHIHQEVFRTSLVWPLSTLARFLEKDLMPLAYRHCTFVTVSESSKKDMRRLNITDKSIEVIYPGVDISQLRPGQKAAVPTVAYVGRLRGYKSVDLLIRAFAHVLAEVPNARLVIAGDGDDMRRLKRETIHLKLQKHVSFLGKVSEEKKAEILREAWVCVNPSQMEGWGITVIEANACGTPVVASNVPGLRDSVRDGETGLLVPYGNILRLAANIIHVLKDETFRTILSRYAIAWAQNFEWKRSSEKFIEVIVGNKRHITPGIPVVQRI